MLKQCKPAFLLMLLAITTTNAQITIKELGFNYGGVFYPADKHYDLVYVGNSTAVSNYVVNGKTFYTLSETWSKAGYIHIFAYPTSLSFESVISINKLQTAFGICYVGYPIRRVAETMAGPVLYNILHIYGGIRTAIYKTKKTALYSTYLIIGRIGKIEDGSRWLKEKKGLIYSSSGTSPYYPYILQDAIGLANKYTFHYILGKKGTKALTLSIKVMYFFIGGGRNLYPFQFEPSIGLTWLLNERNQEQK